jgi:hypothetical protein
VGGAGGPATGALVAATVGLDQVGPVLAGERPAGAAAGPKIHVDPQRDAFTTPLTGRNSAWGTLPS